MPKKLIPMAICYDFDGTLAPGNMQEYDFIPALKMTSGEFWSKVNALSEEQEADGILAYMQQMLEKANAMHISVHKEDFFNYGRNIVFYDGVLEWFKRITAYGKEQGVFIEHYIISSGIREMILGTPIAKEFKKIYASSFMYDHNGVAHWPALAINYTTKTQYLFRINKGSLDTHDDSVINRYIPQEDRPIPFEQIVFVGDGDTDVPCMRLVRDQGGHSIAVYRKGVKDSKTRVQKLVEEGRATAALPADYKEFSPMDLLLKHIIKKIAADNALKQLVAEYAIPADTMKKDIASG